MEIIINKNRLLANTIYRIYRYNRTLKTADSETTVCLLS